MTEPEAAAGPPDAAEDAAIRRLMRLALRGTAMGALTGTAVVVAAVLGVVHLRAGNPAARAGLGSAPGTLLLAGTLGGMLIAAAATWLALAPLGNWFRRGMLGTVSAFATAVLMLLAIPVHARFGPTGLAALLVLCLGGALLLFRSTQR